MFVYRQFYKGISIGLIHIYFYLIKIIKDKHDIDFSISNFEKMFGVFKDNFITHLFLCVKYYI